jgi:probable HAF family extracellular repeat protein
MKLLSRLTPALLPMLWVGLVVVPLAYGQEISAPVKITFTTIDVPGAGVTGVYGINSAGEMVGFYGKTGSPPYRGFLLSSGKFKHIDYPSAYSTTANGINDSGLIVGYAEFNGGTTAQGFKYDGAAFIPLQDGSDSATFVMGVNNAGAATGGAGTIYQTTGFRLQGGQYMTLAFPGQYTYAYAVGVNNLGGMVVGQYDFHRAS